MGIVLLAALLRLWDLDLRPPHFDEGVNGWFTDQMQHLGCYQYDPSNYHGPLHFYVLFLFKVLFGRHLWALRLPVVIVGVLTVDWMFRFERFLGRRACAWAALGMTLSPGFPVLPARRHPRNLARVFPDPGFLGAVRTVAGRGKRYLWAVGMGLTGAILTKETYLIHLGCLALAVPVRAGRRGAGPLRAHAFCRAGGRQAPTAVRGPCPRRRRSLTRCRRGSSPVCGAFAPQAWRERDAWTVAAVGLALILFFYSGNGFHWSGVRGLVTAFEFWGQKSQEGEGHNKPFLYWTRLLLNNEPFALRDVGVQFFTPCRRCPCRRGDGLRGLGSGADGGEPRRIRFPDRALPASRTGGRRGFRTTHPLTPSIYLVLWTLSLGYGSRWGCRVWACARAADWRLRLLAIYGLGNLIAYSLIPYKTPWCVISFAWPFLFVGGAALRSGLSRLTGRYRGTVRRGLPSGARSAGAGARDFHVPGRPPELLPTPTAESEEPTSTSRPSPTCGRSRTHAPPRAARPPRLPHARRHPLRQHVSRCPGCSGISPASATIPTRIAKPPDYRADFLLVVDSRVAEVEAHLDEDYFKETVHLRSAQAPLSTCTSGRRPLSEKGVSRPPARVPPPARCRRAPGGPRRSRPAPAVIRPSTRRTMTPPPPPAPRPSRRRTRRPSRGLKRRSFRGKAERMARPPDDYAKNQRRIRSLQPKVSSDEAHARARRALAKNAAAKPEQSPVAPETPPGAAETLGAPGAATPPLGRATRTPDRPAAGRPAGQPRRRRARGLPGRRDRPLDQADDARQGGQGTARARRRAGSACGPPW